ncbi:WXG100 family type VII secretion target [Zhihengliuella salsuginis]|uniref:WXG100 family type VII secretion target n=1 Tax=Zhihengliuella salsuginis TaxID=578222 RepID=A0ABQ3GLD7_9MICC|nr:WXG100 family type VII secretion target [Zhihengliuella salsuginis]GHD10166.1 hypothetical protein GCM10008096_23450 [Zhihengliuella salsuginis]
MNDFKGKMSVASVGDASKQSEDSGLTLVKLVEEMLDGVEELQTTFKGSAAAEFTRVINEGTRVQGELIHALASISAGQADAAKAYLDMDSEMESEGRDAASVAAAASGSTGFNLGGR